MEKRIAIKAQDGLLKALNKRVKKSGEFATVIIQKALLKYLEEEGAKNIYGFTIGEVISVKKFNERSLKYFIKYDIDEKKYNREKPITRKAYFDKIYNIEITKKEPTANKRFSTPTEYRIASYK